jgi:hypothetical protein
LTGSPKLADGEAFRIAFHEIPSSKMSSQHSPDCNLLRAIAVSAFIFARSLSDLSDGKISPWLSACG